MHNARKYTNRLLELCDEGLVDSKDMLQNALCWMSEDMVKSLTERYELHPMMFPPSCPYCEKEHDHSDVTSGELTDVSEGLFHPECWADSQHEAEVAKAEREEYEREQGPSQTTMDGWAMDDKLEAYRNEY